MDVLKSVGTTDWDMERLNMSVQPAILHMLRGCGLAGSLVRVNMLA